MSAKREKKFSAKLIKPDTPDKEKNKSTRPQPDKIADAVFSKPLRSSTHSAGAMPFFKRVAPTIAFGITLFVLLEHFGSAMSLIGSVFSALVPVFVGIGLAFILNIPMQLFESQAFFWIKHKGLRRGLSIFLCYMLLAAFLFTLMFVVIPQLTIALPSLSSMLPDFGAQMYNVAAELVQRYKLDADILKYLQFDWNSIAMNVIEWTTASLPQLVNTTRNITGRVFEIFIGLVLSVYMLYGKERLAGHGRRVCYAILKHDWAERIINIASLAQTTFRGYVAGSLTEACILGALTAAGMWIFGFPSPVFAGVLMGIGALVPIFGIFIMISVNALLIAVQTNIQTGLWFVLYIVVLQQFEGNLIYPRVMGNAIRLPGMWVLTAATVGGTLFGLFGLLLSIPTVSILYSLMRAFIIYRERHTVPETTAVQSDSKSAPSTTLRK